MTEASELINRAFESMMTAADKRAEHYSEALAKATESGRCPNCSTEGQPLDFDDSLLRSVEKNRVVRSYKVCDRCATEAKAFARLARMGVPRRVRHATLENYQVSTPDQGKVIERLRDWLSDANQLNLVLIGKCGTGKGHLAAAIVKELDRPARWTHHAEIVSSYHAEEFNNRPQLLSRYQRIPVLVIDEMGGKGMTTDTPEIFYSILNERDDKGLVTILIGNIPYRSKDERRPSILSIIGAERAESRFFAGTTVIPCRWEDFRKTPAYAAMTRRHLAAPQAD